MNGIPLNEFHQPIRAEEDAATDLYVVDTAVEDWSRSVLGLIPSTFAALGTSSSPSSLCPLCIGASAGFVGLGWVDMEFLFIAGSSWSATDARQTWDAILRAAMWRPG
jgi:hypothetical protein